MRSKQLVRINGLYMRKFSFTTGTRSVIRNRVVHWHMVIWGRKQRVSVCTPGLSTKWQKRSKFENGDIKLRNGRIFKTGPYSLCELTFSTQFRKWGRISHSWLFLGASGHYRILKLTISTHF